MKAPVPEIRSDVFDSRSFRNALGCFATGVAIVTTVGRQGENLGLTVNSFSSVSLDPPLILWSLASNSSLLSAFEDCEYFAVNILSASQSHVSHKFATRGADKFAGVAIKQGLGGVPLLEGCCAWFECRNEQRHIGGDHRIFVGRVERFEQTEAAPLGFFRGRYNRLIAMGNNFGDDIYL